MEPTAFAQALAIIEAKKAEIIRESFDLTRKLDSAASTIRAEWREWEAEFGNLHHTYADTPRKTIRQIHQSQTRERARLARTVHSKPLRVLKGGRS